VSGPRKSNRAERAALTGLAAAAGAVDALDLAHLLYLVPNAHLATADLGLAKCASAIGVSVINPASVPGDDRSAMIFVIALESAARLSEFGHLLERRLILVTLASAVIEDRSDGLATALTQIVQE
jgi:hypothetical protein